MTTNTVPSVTPSIFTTNRRFADQCPDLATVGFNNDGLAAALYRMAPGETRQLRAGTNETRISESGPTWKIVLSRMQAAGVIEPSNVGEIAKRQHGFGAEAKGDSLETPISLIHLHFGYSLHDLNPEMVTLADEMVFTTGEAARLLSVSRGTIARHFDRCKLHGFRVPGSPFRRIPTAELLRYALRQHGERLPDSLQDYIRARRRMEHDCSELAKFPPRLI